MSLFLPREVGSIETGPQTFAGTNVLNTTFYFISNPEAPGLLNSVLVENAGLNNINGTFTYVTEFENKPYYSKGLGDLFIVWFENQWQIFDFSQNSTVGIYYSSENVLYPWNVTTWFSINPIYNPVPKVSKII